MHASVLLPFALLGSFAPQDDSLETVFVRADDTRIERVARDHVVVRTPESEAPSGEEGEVVVVDLGALDPIEDQPVLAVAGAAAGRAGLVSVPRTFADVPFPSRRRRPGRFPDAAAPR